MMASLQWNGAQDVVSGHDVIALLHAARQRLHAPAVGVEIGDEQDGRLVRIGLDGQLVRRGGNDLGRTLRTWLRRGRGRAFQQHGLLRIEDWIAELGENRITARENFRVGHQQHVRQRRHHALLNFNRATLWADGVLITNQRKKRTAMLEIQELGYMVRIAPLGESHELGVAPHDRRIVAPKFVDAEEETVVGPVLGQHRTGVLRVLRHKLLHGKRRGGVQM